MERTLLRLLLASALALQTPTTIALDARVEETIRAATFEFVAPSIDSTRESLVGTAFAIGPNKLVTAAHLLDAAIGSHFGPPQLVDSQHVTYRIADLLQYSEQQDYAVFALERPPASTPLSVLRKPPPGREPQLVTEVYFAGWRGDGKIAINRGVLSGLTRDQEPQELDWLRFSGQIWNSLGGGPLLDGSGGVIGIVQARARDSGANYAVPINALGINTSTLARIHGMDMLRSLMPVVSAIKPLEGAILLPLSFAQFSRQLQQMRLEYIDRTVKPLLEAARGNFALMGAGARETCSLLNGKACQCKGRAGLSGTLILDDPHAEELLAQFNKGEEVAQVVAGVTIVRTPDEGDLANNPGLHLSVALRAPARQPNISMRLVSRASADSQEVYTDFHNRTWHLRTWPLEHQDRIMISLARKLPDGYVVMTRTMPTALSVAAAMQVKFIANLVYYGCEQSPAEGIAQVADATLMPGVSHR